MNKSSQQGSRNRRTFIKQSAIVSLGFLALARCSNGPRPEAKGKAPGLASAGTSKIQLQSDSEGYLDLPEGFSYRVISRQGQRMSDGFLVPARPDGMGTFDGGNGKVVIVRNHENSPNDSNLGPFGERNELLDQIDSAKLYDAGKLKKPGRGGTTTLVYDEEREELEQQFLSLAGTYRNCAGGITPWNSWLTCEEDTTLKKGTIEKDHGFVFEVPARVEPGVADPLPITAMGRFNHEAVVVDPKTGIVYQTEDEGDGLIYRYIPNVPGQLLQGGRLQALVIIDQPGFDTRNWKERSMELRQQLKVGWIDLEEVLSPEDDLRYRGFEAGAARFARGEGMWFGNNEFFFACTNGGPKKWGQVFRYQPSPLEGKPGEKEQPATLELYAESTDRELLNMCDNLTIAPWGDVILCEDNGQRNHIRGINKNGEIYNFACNRSSRSEFAGLVFSPSGKTLFVNVQENGDTLAITGPWDSLMV
ncbi:MAG: alkaline phosphatase PhoX [Bacteroidota bacterium]